MRIIRWFIAIAVAVLLLIVATPTANAAPFQGGDYGIFPFEGRYPTAALCGSFRQVAHGSLSVRDGSLDWGFYYSPRCGVFGRIDHVRLGIGVYCYMAVYRSDSSAHSDDGYIRESVDPGIDYAYTKIANDLSGRVAQMRVSMTESTVSIDGYHHQYVYQSSSWW